MTALSNETIACLSSLLRQSQPIEAAFENLLEKEINISKGMRETASQSQKRIRDIVISESGRDFSFPKVLAKEDSDFLGGSFARHTKIWPLDDIDIYFPLDGSALYYFEYGVIQPVTVTSDSHNLTNPLLGAGWTNRLFNFNVSSQKLIDGFAKVLKRTYPESSVRKDGQAVNVRLTHFASENKPGLGFDVVPCFLLRSRTPEAWSFYLIPNGTNGWLKTNPRFDEYIATKLHSENNKTFRKAVKILKYWNETALNSVINSYYIELAVAKAFLRINTNGHTISSLSQAVSVSFQALNEAVANGDQLPWLECAPAVKAGDVGLKSFFLWKVATDSAKAYELESAGKTTAAIQKWQEIFGDKFKY